MSGPKPEPPQPPVELPSRVKHGSLRAHIKYKCRCALCQEHRRAYAKRLYEIKRKQKPRPVPEGMHGRVHTYNYYRCRCDLCTDARSAYERERVAKRERELEEREP